jgi:hypothetical protein
MPIYRMMALRGGLRGEVQAGDSIPSRPPER